MRVAQVRSGDVGVRVTYRQEGGMSFCSTLKGSPPLTGVTG